MENLLHHDFTFIPIYINYKAAKQMALFIWYCYGGEGFCVCHLLLTQSPDEAMLHQVVGRG